MVENLQRIKEEGDNPVALERDELPTASWSGIPDAALLRILAVSRGVEGRGLPLAHIRIHCTEYFAHIANDVNKAKFDSELKILLDSCGDGCEGYVARTSKLIITLEQAKELLDMNAARW